MKLGFCHLSYSCFEMGRANVESENRQYTGGSLSFADLLKRGWLGDVGCIPQVSKSCVPEASKSCSHRGNSKGDVGRDHC
jgi:hypothetical protein